MRLLQLLRQIYLESLIRRLDACAVVNAMVPSIEGATEKSRKAGTLMRAGYRGAVVDDVTAHLAELARVFFAQSASRSTTAHTHGTAVQRSGDNRDVEIAAYIARGEELLGVAGKILEESRERYRLVGGTVEG